MRSWIEITDDSDFSLSNLPYGVFETGKDDRAHLGVAIGRQILDLTVLAEEGILDHLDMDVRVFREETLNAFAALGSNVHAMVRREIERLLQEDTDIGHILRDDEGRRERALVLQSAVRMRLPMLIGDYTDFFVGQPHAETCMEILRPGVPFNEAVPSFFTLPIAYHGRASSVVVSDTNFHRPKGQSLKNDRVQFGACQRLDFEVELACFISHGNTMGASIEVDNAEDHIFGVVLMNDWSARDIQQWESTLMGPFQGKNFCTTVSPWIVPLAALEPFRTKQRSPHRDIFPYLQERREESVYDIPIKAILGSDEQRFQIALCNSNNVIFSLPQIVAHHTASGCPLRTGDLIATGTLSGRLSGEQGCMLEITSNGELPYEMREVGSPAIKLQRRFLEDGDSVELTAHMAGTNGRGNVGFGSCRGRVLAAVP